MDPRMKIFEAQMMIERKKKELADKIKHQEIRKVMKKVAKQSENEKYTTITTFVVPLQEVPPVLPVEAEEKNDLQVSSSSEVTFQEQKKYEEKLPISEEEIIESSDNVIKISSIKESSKIYIETPEVPILEKEVPIPEKTFELPSITTLEVREPSLIDNFVEEEAQEEIVEVEEETPTEEFTDLQIDELEKSIKLEKELSVQEELKRQMQVLLQKKEEEALRKKQEAMKLRLLLLEQLKGSPVPLAISDNLPKESSSHSQIPTTDSTQRRSPNLEEISHVSANVLNQESGVNNFEFNLSGLNNKNIEEEKLPARNIESIEESSNKKSEISHEKNKDLFQLPVLSSEILPEDTQPSHTGRFPDLPKEFTQNSEPEEKLQTVIMPDLSEQNNATFKPQEEEFKSQEEEFKSQEEELKICTLPEKVETVFPSEKESQMLVIDMGKSDEEEKNHKFEAFKDRQMKRYEKMKNKAKEKKENAGLHPQLQEHSPKAFPRKTSQELISMTDLTTVESSAINSRDLSEETVVTKPKLKKTPSFSKSNNRQLIKNAITDVLLAGEPNRKKREEVLKNLISIPPCYNVVVVFKEAMSRRQDFKALYLFNEEAKALELIHGPKDAPPNITQTMVHEFFRYDSGSKEFRHIPGNKNFSIAVDAVSLTQMALKKKKLSDNLL